MQSPMRAHPTEPQTRSPRAEARRPAPRAQTPPSRRQQLMDAALWLIAVFLLASAAVLVFGHD